MIKKLSAVGNSLALIIERPVLELLHIHKNTLLEVVTDGEALIIRPARKKERKRVKKSAARMMKAHKAVLEKLAE